MQHKEKHLMKSGLSVGKLVTFIILIIGGITMLLPFVWMLLSSMKTNTELLRMPPTWLPEKGFWIGNYKQVLELISFDRYIMNSLLIAVINTVAGLFTSAFTGYIFAKYDFRGKNIIFIFLLGSMMIPFQVIMIPMYSMMIQVDWIDSYYALTIPYFVSMFGVFLMRQSMTALPNDLMDAAFIDGCSHFRTFFEIMLPLVKTSMSALAIFLFMGSWNDYLWPLIVIDSEVMRTITIGLGVFVHQRGMKYDLLMAASVMAILPMLIVFFSAQKNFIEGITLTGMKS
jgi:ABC-type glycerol-3-phosphate transport system permease component